jgi:hypothetical protein
MELAILTGVNSSAFAEKKHKVRIKMPTLIGIPNAALSG